MGRSNLLGIAVEAGCDDHFQVADSLSGTLVVIPSTPLFRPDKREVHRTFCPLCTMVYLGVSGIRIALRQAKMWHDAYLAFCSLATHFRNYTFFQRRYGICP